MLLTIITVCYEIENEIHKTCKSIVDQTATDFEWLVIDGGSKDNTLSILKKYENKINLLVSEKDRGIYDAMNKGIKLAKGEYVIFMNGGDAFADNEVLLKFNNTKDKKEVNYGMCRELRENDISFITDYPEKLNLEYFLGSNISHQSTFIKRGLFNKYGYYDLKYRIIADYEKWICLLSKGVSFSKLPFVVSIFNAFEGISSKKKSLDIVDKEKAHIINKYYSREEIALYYIKKKRVLEEELVSIYNSKFFKLWRRYCHLKEKITGKS